ncbi:hypothetical protein RND71_035782 [Anisodus tanguticus]|uniref:Transmembrane protein n=1 Tax=Anisodus tanguticus TaxID=243964 RepID=A0AAE1R651_9SOLA|nr:hypothetical protein RND71_035782 [Anisodus tanguticus]
MELKASFTVIFFLLLLLLAPCSSSGKMDLLNLDSGIYEIDYRGPETHSHIPTLNRSKGRHNGCTKGLRAREENAWMSLNKV